MLDLPIIITNESVAEAARVQISKILPIVKAHGGGVDILKATDDQLVLGLSGHCAGCPIAPMTYGVVLNKFLMEALPQLKSIKYVDLKG
ncbi:MAG: Nitrogen-fixing NifU protein [Candidatus Doudnabacteria bacterium]|nr:Nitrogen-fixing NifU protein [Candidatus Doudnabacteria bacterium]